MVIENANLRDFVSKGPKYREPNKTNWNATGKVLFESIDLYAEQWAKREQVTLKHLSEWKDWVNELVVDRISGLKGNLTHQKAKLLSNLMSKIPWRNYMLILFQSLLIKLLKM